MRRRGQTARSRAEKLAAIKRETERERDRHANKMLGLGKQRDALGGIVDPALRLAKLSKISSDFIEEQQRNKAKLEALDLRRWKAWQ